ncbi:CMD domain-containing protein [Mesorhizobium sp. L-2-11]|uniref:CMD domain-containing protein n=1 Tax=Mesorhizobium sp. L-2-11 TaxID=2744521 RepID=UPI001928232C|nr:hypothetical protein [Mesorhizobium sp. L-2-11]BCH17855.1 hypothetical protein MesoLjLa_47060 [Mesorhizobium sp. L-2-11]
MNDVLLRLSGIDPQSELAKVIAKRADIFELTEKTHDAALRPADPGGLSHAMRAAIACRIASLNGDAAFRDHFGAMLDQAAPDEIERQVSDLDFKASDPRISALIRHADLVAANPRSASGRDIELLRQAGIAEADVVRLSELVAFVSYQIRVVAGLRLMRQSA